MECSNCGYNNPPAGTRDGKCDNCGSFLITNNSPQEHSVAVNAERLINNEFLVIATFYNPVEASLTQGILKEQGIESWLKDEATVNIAWHLAIAVGGIKLCVQRTQAELSKELLEEYLASLNAETLESNQLNTEVENEASTDLNITDKTLTRALLTAIIGLLLLPLQLYSLWLLLTILCKGIPKTSKQISTFVITLGLDLASLIVVATLISLI